MPSRQPPSRSNQALIDARKSLRLTQQELARQIGVSRQFLNQMETAGALPNVVVALDLAALLGTSVEQLFRRAAPAPENPEAALADAALSTGARVRLGRIGTRWVAHPAETTDSFPAGFDAADAILLADARVRLLAEPARVERNLLIAGCDPALRLLQPAEPDQGRWHWINCGSGRALDLLRAGMVHVAGIHYPGAGGRGNLRELASRDPERAWLIVEFSRWEQGWLLRRGMAPRFNGASTLRRGNWILANRDPSTAARHWLDQTLAQAHVAPTAVKGYESDYRSGTDAVRAVAEGRADVTVGSKAAALTYGLDFVAGEAVSFDLVVSRSWWRSPAGRVLHDRIATLAASGELATLPGYSAAAAGNERRRGSV